MKCRKACLGFLLLITLVCGPTVLAQRRRTPPPSRPKAPYSAYIPIDTEKLSPEKKARVEAFEKVWRTILYYYFDGKFNNLNWESVKFEFTPKILAAKTDSEVHDHLETMLDRLKSSHLGIIRPAVFEEIETAKEMARERAREREALLASGNADEEDAPPPNFDDPLAIYGPGIDLRLIGERFVVFRVGPNSAAEYRGIKPGYVIDSIDDVSLTSLLSRVRIYAKGEAAVIRHLPNELVSEMLNGDKDSTVKLGYLDAEDKKGEVVLRRELLPTTTVSMGTNHPESQLTFEARALDERTGYIHFDNFSLPVIEKFCSALAELGSKERLVIDLRGNVGGVLGVSMALAGMLSDKPLDLGTSIYRFGPESLISQPKARQFKGKIVVLTDEQSVSAAEMFAASLQAAKRAKVVGTRTAGESLPSVTVELATGARLLYPIANYRTADGRYLEGSGVTPDVVVPLDRATLAKGRDPQLEAALNELSKPDAVGVGSTGNSKALGQGQGSGIGSAAAPPPPAPPKPKPAPRSLGTVTIKVPPPLPNPPDPPDLIEPKAAALIKEFEKLAGGHDAYSAITGYELAGSVDSVYMAARQSQQYFSYRQGTERIMVVLKSPAIGETRTVRDGKTLRVTSDLGTDIERPYPVSIHESDFLYSITRSMKPENYKKLVYLGVFDRGERKVHLIDGKTTDGITVAIYFDTETKLLAGFEGPTGGLSFGDYRKIGELMFPFNISSQDFLNIQLNEVKLNSKIDPAVFEKKINCYDKP